MSSVPAPSRSPSTSASRSRSGPSNVPYGIYVIAGLGFLGALLGVMSGLALLGESHPFLGLVVLALAVGEAIVLVGLLRLQSWAWTVALLLYGVGALFDLIAGDLIGILISVIFIMYLVTIADAFE